MPRKPNIIPSSIVNVALPLPERTKLDFFLHSEVEGRVPLGAYKEFFSARIREFFDSKNLDLSPYLGTTPGTAIVRGAPEVIEMLKAKLEA